jgi:hypothetical protein
MGLIRACLVSFCPEFVKSLSIPIPIATETAFDFIDEFAHSILDVLQNADNELRPGLGRLLRFFDTVVSVEKSQWFMVFLSAHLNDFLSLSKEESDRVIDAFFLAPHPSETANFISSLLG